MKSKEIAAPLIERLQNIGENVEKAEGSALVAESPFIKIAYDHIKGLVAQARQFVREEITNDAVKWHEDYIIEQVPFLVDRIERGLPPNEIVRTVDEDGAGTYETEPAHLPAIFLAGWVYESYWQKEYKEDGRVMKYMTMCTLLLKACEDSRLIMRRRKR